MSYIGVNLHFLDKNFNFCNYNLGTRIVSQSHTSENTAKIIENILKEFEFNNFNDLTIVSDAACNMIKASEILKAKHYICFAHSLHNILIYSIDIYDKLLENCRYIIRKFKYK